MNADNVSIKQQKQKQNKKHMNENQNLTGNINLDEVPETKPVYITKRSGVVRCIDVKWEAQNKKGNPMLTFTYEIVKPEIVEAPEIVDGKPALGGPLVKAQVGGNKIKTYLVLNNKYSAANIKEIHKAMDLPPTFNADNPNINQYKGKAVKCLISTEVQVEMQEGTIDQPLLDDDGKPMNRLSYRISNISGGSRLDDVVMPY